MPVPAQPGRVFYWANFPVSFNGVFLRVHTKFLSFRVAGIIFLFLFALLVSCKKDPRVLDTSVQPEGDKFSASVVEEYPVSAYTFPHEDFISFNSKDKFLGTNIDPVFGRTEIGLYLNVNNGNEGAKFANSVFVSAEFRLVTDNNRIQGKVDAPCTYSIFTVDSVLNPKRFYVASNDKLHSPVPLPGTTTGFPVGSGPGGLMVVGLDPTYAEQMFHDTPSWASNAEFQKKYKGFYILGTPSGGEGQIMTCDLDAASSGLFIFYKASATATTVDSIRMAFNGELAVRYNTVKHDYTQASTNLQNQLGGDTTVTEYIYLQGMGGTKARLTIPVIPFISDSFQLAISRAELILPADPSYISEQYDYPPSISLLAVSSEGKDSLVFDQANATDNSRYGGEYDKVNSRYVFNIARHMQAVVKGQVINRGFHLVVSDPARAGTFFRDEHFERVVLNGPKHATLRPTFRLTYSKVSIR